MNIAIIGCGVMGSGMAEQLGNIHSLLLYDKEKSRADLLASKVNGHAYESAQQTIKNADMIILAMKPQHFKDFTAEIASYVRSNQIIVSLLSGTSLEVLEKEFPTAPIVRIMPNLAVRCGKGVIGMVDSPKLTDLKSELEKIFQPLGLIYWLKENQIDALTALTGSGPAFILALIEAMIETGVLLGFQAADAQKLILHTIKGSLALLEETQQHPAQLRWQIASPGGTTIAGMRVMEQEKVRSGVMETFIATYEKSVLLSQIHSSKTK